MARVVAGRYVQGVQLKDLYHLSSKYNNHGMLLAPEDAVNNSEVLSCHVDVEALSCPVYIADDWEERHNHWDWTRTKGLIVTENDLKHWEADYPLRHTPLVIESKRDFISGPDSEEIESTSIDIAFWKGVIGCDEPYKYATQREKEEAFTHIDVRNGKHVLKISSDRELGWQNVLRHSTVWDPYRDLPLVEEGFRQRIFPGLRVNELQNAVGGAANLLDLFQKSKAELRLWMETDTYPDHLSKDAIAEMRAYKDRKGDRWSEDLDYHKSYETVFFQFLEYDPSQPLPEEGVYITGAEYKRKFRHLSDEELERIREEELKGKQVDLNDYDVVSGYGGATITDLEKDHESGYFKYSFPMARVMCAFAEIMAIPKLENPRTVRLEDMRSARLISNLNFGECALDFKGEREGQLGKYKRVQSAIRIKDRNDFDNAFIQTDGAIAERWPEEAPDGVNQKLYELEKRLITQLFVANRATVKPLGDATAYAKPLMIHDDIIKNQMRAYFNGTKYKTITSKDNNVFFRFSDRDGFMSRLARGAWNVEKMRQPSPYPATGLMGDDDLYYLTDCQGSDLVEALVGSASSHLPSGNKHARFYSQESAKKKLTMVTGGGGRKIMGAFLEGFIETQKSGDGNALTIAHRVPLASRKEGSLQALMEKFDVELEAGHYDGNYQMALNDRMHIYTHDHYAERLDAIIGPADVVTSFIGGVGTEDEYVWAMYHNLMVEMRGYGVCPNHGDKNFSKKQLHFVNSEVPNGQERTGYYDALSSMFTEEEQKILGMHFYDTPEQALHARDQYARECGYDIDTPRKDPSQNCGNELSYF